MSSDVLVTLLETVVFLNVVQKVATDDDGTVHLVGLDDSLQDTATDVDLCKKTR